MADAKIAGGTVEQREMMSEQMATDAAASAAEVARLAAIAQEAEQKRQADAAAMAAVERAEAERLAKPPPPPTAKPAPPARSAPAHEDADRIMREAEAIRARAEVERARLEKLGDDYEVRLRRERDRDRIAALRRMGAIPGVSDVQLLMISPDVDPDCPSGKASLDAWREANTGLFLAQSGPRLPTAEEMIGTMKSQRSPHGHYGPELFASILKRNLERSLKE